MFFRAFVYLLLTCSARSAPQIEPVDPDEPEVEKQEVPEGMFKVFDGPL